MDEIRAVAKQFYPSAINIQPLGNGYINDTYRVDTAAKPFVLQRINKRVFPQPEHIMANLVCLSNHIGLHHDLQISLKIPQLLVTHSGEHYINDIEGDYWRALDFIDNTESLETIDNLEQARQVGAALGQFHRLTQTLSAESLFDTLPGFHIAPEYFRQYQQVIVNTCIQENTECADFINKNKSIINDLETAKEKGLLISRTIHGDPKLNNFLFDKTSRQVVSLVDLDTVKPGLIHYDIGDCLRSCCHIGSNDEFSLAICQAVLGSYLIEMKATFSEADWQALYPAIRLIPYELGLRFYTDYLAGNRYFKVSEPEENLQRALSQFRLCASVIRQETDIMKLIGDLQII